MAIKKEQTIQQVENLKKLNLPENWKMIKAEISFQRSGILGEWAQVIWDSSNETFYVKTNKCIVYPQDTNPLKEAIEIMLKANKVMNSSRNENSPV